MADIIRIRPHHLNALKEYLTGDKQEFFNVTRTGYGECLALFIISSFEKIIKGEANVQIVSALDDICREGGCDDSACRKPDFGPDMNLMNQLGLEIYRHYNGTDISKRIIESYKTTGGKLK